MHVHVPGSPLTIPEAAEVWHLPELRSIRWLPGSPNMSFIFFGTIVLSLPAAGTVAPEFDSCPPANRVSSGFPV